ncbi:MAG: hypothetical protein ACQKBT_11970, partial [Puniceicoccales bacterium]
ISGVAPTSQAYCFLLMVDATPTIPPETDRSSCPDFPPMGQTAILFDGGMTLDSICVTCG